MDTRKLELVVGLYDEPVIVDEDSDNGDEIGRIYTTGDDAFDLQDRIPLGEELVRRWNSFPALVEALDMMQEALASYRDGNGVLVDHPEHGFITTLEEVKYLVVDPALKAASE